MDQHNPVIRPAPELGGEPSEAHQRLLDSAATERHAGRQPERTSRMKNTNRLEELEDVLAGIRTILSRDDDLRSLDVRAAVERLMIQRDTSREAMEQARLLQPRLETRITKLAAELSDCYTEIDRLNEAATRKDTQHEYD